MLRRLAGLLAVLATVAALVLGTAGTAIAHAALLSTDPAPNSVLPTAPKAVTLTFSEGVTLFSDSIRVLDPGGKQVDAGDAGHADGRDDTARVSLHGGLADGTYTVAWRAISADSHPVGGAFTFSVGAPGGTAVKPSAIRSTAADGLVSFGYGAGRLVGYGAFALLAGGAAFVLICWPAGGAVARVRRLLWSGWIGLLVATVAVLLLRGPYERGTGVSQAFDVSLVRSTLHERIGTALAVRLLLLAAAAVFLALLVGQSRQDRARIWLGVAGLVLATALAATWVTVDHSAVGIQVWLAMPLTALHMLAMALWLGGLATLAIALGHAHGPGTSATDRFSPLALGAVTVLVATGVYQSWRGVGSWGALVDTEYGRLLLIKVGCVAAMVGVAWISRNRATKLRAVRASRNRPAEADAPARAVLRRSVLAESAVAVVVLVVTTMLTNSPPGRVAQALPTAPQGTPTAGASASPIPAVEVRLPYDTGGRTANAKGTAIVRISPGAAGSNAVQLEVDDAAGKPTQVPEVQLTFSLPARGLTSLPGQLTAEGTGRWSSTVQLPLPGTWVVAVTVRSSDIDQTTSRQDVRIGG